MQQKSPQIAVYFYSCSVQPRQSPVDDELCILERLWGLSLTRIYARVLVALMCTCVVEVAQKYPLGCTASVAAPQCAGTTFAAEAVSSPNHLNPPVRP